MKKTHILKKNHDFQNIIKKKKTIVTKEIVIYYLLNKKKFLRIGISISKRLINAVKRNKLRRQIKHILDKLNLYEASSKDVVLIIRKPFLKMSFENKTKKIKNILERL